MGNWRISRPTDLTKKSDSLENWTHSNPDSLPLVNPDKTASDLHPVFGPNSVLQNCVPFAILLRFRWVWMKKSS